MSKWRLAAFFTIVCLTSSVNPEVDGTADDPDDMLKMAAVIGGQEFEEGKWPWMASLQGKIPKLMVFGIPLLYERLYCGASLLNDRWILTAAHCFPIEQRGYRAVIPRYWHIRLGGRKLSASLKHRLRGYFGRLLNIDSWKQWYIHGEKIFIHPEYDAASTWQNDIALVKLREAVPVSEELIPEIQAVTLPERNNTEFPADGARCIMVGWGCTARGGYVSSVAREAILPKIPDDECGRFWNVSTDARLCAGYNLAHKGICRGDSGGPLMCPMEDKWVQVGIASFTSKNAPGNVPAAFTRVSPYIDWINETISEN